MAIPLTLLVIVGVTNAVNLADGLDGLAGGLSLISFAGIAYLAYQANEPLLVLLMMAVLGGLLGFLRFNTYPAKIFMGDAGSQFLGHYLAVAAILLTDSTRTMYSPLLALFIWGVPLLDTIGVMGQRLMEGRSPFVGDRNHIHHKLLARGLTHGQAVSVIYLAHAVMVSCAYLLRWQSDVVLIAVYLLWAVAILSMFVRWPHRVTSRERSHRSSTFRTCGKSSIATADWGICVQGAPASGSPISHRIGGDAEGNSMGCRDDRCGTADCGGGINGFEPRNSVGGAGGSVCREHVPDVLQ